MAQSQNDQFYPNVLSKENRLLDIATSDAIRRLYSLFYRVNPNVAVDPGVPISTTVDGACPEGGTTASLYFSGPQYRLLGAGACDGLELATQFTPSGTTAPILQLGDPWPYTSGGWDYSEFYLGSTTPVWRWHRSVPAASEPAVSATDSVSFYYDTTNDTIKISQNGGAYAAITTGATASGWTDVSTTVSLTTSTDNVVIGSSTYNSSLTNQLQLIRVNNSQGLDVITYSSTATHNPYLLMIHARGTQGSPTATQSADVLGHMRFGGYSGADYTVGGGIKGYAAANWTTAPTDTPGDIAFETVPAGSGVEVERMRLLSTGHLRFTEQTTNPGTTQLASLSQMAIYMKADKFVIAYNNGGTITYITLDMDGSDTTWAHGTSAP